MKEISDRSILVERLAGVAVITLNAPDRLNAIDTSMAQALDQALAETGSDPEIRVILITGAGRGFCAGASMDRLAEVGSGGSRTLTSGSPSQGDQVFERFDAPPQLRTRYTVPLAIPKPVIAAINGACAGAGLMLALACDIRIASNTAKFVASFAKMGLIAEGTCAFLLPRIAGYGLANDMLLSGRSVDADEALRAGLVTSVTPALDFQRFAQNYAASIAASVSPTSTRVIKHQLQHALNATLTQSIDLAYAETLAAIGRADLAEGIRAYKEKRLPNFPSRLS